MITKRERNAELVMEYLAEPRRTLQEIGDKYGISRERVRQIASWAGAPPRGPKPMTAPPPECAREGCSKPTPQIRRNRVYRKYCSDEHRTPPPVIKQCAACGKDVAVPLRVVKSRAANWDKHPLRRRPQTDWFCNKSCAGAWLGRTHGFNGTLRKQTMTTERKLSGIAAEFEWALKQIAVMAPPDDWEYYAGLGDYNGYEGGGKDDPAYVDEPDTSNNGDMLAFGSAIGRHQAARIARKALRRSE